MTQVLKGIRVLDFGRYIAGPFCGTLLADMGAEVIRIEKVDGSEDRYLAPISDTDDGGTFMQLARNKKGLTLNPMKPEGREIVKKIGCYCRCRHSKSTSGYTRRNGIGLRQPEGGEARHNSHDDFGVWPRRALQ